MKWIAAISLLVISVAGVAASDRSSAVSFYDSQLFTINYQMFGGLQLTYQGQASSVNFGIPDNFRMALSQYPDSKALVESYSGLNLAGNILTWGGLGIVLGDAVFALASVNSRPSSGFSSGTYQTVLIVDGVGLVFSLVGAFILPASFEKLTRAANTYNREKLAEFDSAN